MEERENSPASSLPEVRLWLERILAGMGVSCGIQEQRRNGYTVLNVLAGRDGPLVIGPKGQTLNSIQHLIGRILERNHGLEASRRILIDAEGYRERRLRNLLREVARAADAVRDNGETAALSPMNSYERFHVYQALRRQTGVAAVSEGEGRLKRILIVPAE